MDLMWVRSVQAAGGKSRWHLLVEKRAGLLYRSDKKPAPFALTACGEAYGEPFELSPGVQPDLWNPGVTVPATAKPYHMNTRVCDTCRATAWRLLNSQPT